MIGQSSFVYAADNSLLGAIPAERNRTPVSLARMSPWLRKATVAVEDRRFYEHGGVDYQGIARALWQDLRAGKIVEGGSTITQQLVRNLYISNEQTLQRKLVEACLAIKLSRHWAKDRILDAYLNQVYYGNHAYGVEAAAETYFSAHASQLDLAQAALVAGLPQAPSLYDPLYRPAEALARRDEVLKAMLDNGDVTPAQYRAAVSERNLRLRPGRLYTRIREPYFFGFVRDQLIEEYGASTVRSGGLRVYTTIDPRLQAAARAAIRSTLDRPSDPSAAIVAVNPRNGWIRAMASLTPTGEGEFNLASQARRQPGSTFKAIVLAAAIGQGINPATTSYYSAPFHYQPDPLTPAWDVSTYDHTYGGWMTLEQATLRSDNTVYAQLMLDVGPRNVVDLARRLGIQTPLPAVPSLALGSGAVTPLDMASAYATIAAGGVYSRPIAIRRVVLADGKEDADAGWGDPHHVRVLPESVAYAVTRILEENIRYGTSARANIDRPAAAKTGTTDNHADAWLCGYTPSLEATVWVGYPQAEIPMLDVHGAAVSGGTLPADIWKSFMEPALGSSKPLDWTPPATPPAWIPFHRGQYALVGPPPAPPGAPKKPHTVLAIPP